MILEIKHSLNDLDTKLILFWKSVKITMQYRIELLGLTVNYFIFFPNQIISEKFKSLYQDNASVDMTLNEFRVLISTCREGEHSTSHHWFDKSYLNWPKSSRNKLSIFST